MRTCCRSVRNFHEDPHRRQGRERNTDHVCLISCQCDCTKSSYNDLKFVQKLSDHPLLKGLDRVNPQGNFLMQEMSSHKQRTRGHSLKLVKPRHRTWKRNQFFSSRVVNAWNKLSAKTVSSRTVNMFKHNYDHYDQNMTRRQPL